MILHKLKIFNFRQFKGEQEIIFSDEMDAGGNNVTVIFGENGRGKTGIFRAVMFCLFGDRMLSQDGEVHGSELNLVNLSAMEHNSAKPVEAFVELQFSHKKHHYTLKRTLLAMRDGGKIHEENGNLLMLERLQNGNSKEIEPVNIERQVDSILDKRVKDYFLFDGEKIERLTRADASQRREIAKGIRKILNVDALDTAIKALGKITTSLDDEVRKNASPEYAKLLKKRGDNEVLRTEKKKLIDEYEDELYRAKNEIVKIDKELDKFKEVRHLVKARKDAEDSLNDLNRKASESLLNMNKYTLKVSSCLVISAITSVYEHINSQKLKGEIPSEIRKDLIEKILTEKKCICGNPICDGTESQRRILDWLRKTSDVQVQDSALTLWRDLSEIKLHIEDDKIQIRDQLLNYANLRNDIEKTDRDLKDFHQQIGTPERQDASKLDAQRKDLEDKLRNIEAQIIILKNSLELIESENVKYSALIKEEQAKSNRRDELSKKALLARETRDALSAVYSDFTKEIKDIIGKKATELFQILLDADGKENLKEIIVKDDYSLQVLDRWDKFFLANISAGQRQIMSIAFITALAQVASRNSLLEMPLFMDTPFGRLSSEHRKNLINTVPALASQWILLATDTEFRKQESQLLRAGKRWGKFYMLRSGRDGNTVIEEKKINDAHYLLKEEEVTQ